MAASITNKQPLHSIDVNAQAPAVAPTPAGLAKVVKKTIVENQPLENQPPASKTELKDLKQKSASSSVAIVAKEVLPKKDGKLLEKNQCKTLVAPSPSLSSSSSVAPNAKLNAAIKAGDLDKIYYELTHGALLQHPGGTEDSPLNVAISTGNMQVVQHLYSVGTDVNFSHGTTSALNHAIKIGSLKMVRFLLERRAAIHLADRHGVYPFMAAAVGPSRQIEEIVLQKTLNHAFPLHECIYAFDSEASNILVKGLIDSGANVHQSDHYGLSPMALAMAYKKEGVCMLLSEAGASQEDARQILLTDAARLIWGFENPIEIQGEKGKYKLNKKYAYSNLTAFSFIEILKQFNKDCLHKQVKLVNYFTDFMVINRHVNESQLQVGLKRNNYSLFIGGYPGHYIGFFVTGTALWVCDRSLKRPGIYRYRLKVPLDALSKENPFYASSADAMYKGLEAVGRAEEYFEMSRQAKFNCSWTSLEGLIFAVGFHLFGGKAPVAKALFNKFAAYAKKYVQNELKKKFPANPILQLMK